MLKPLIYLFVCAKFLQGIRNIICDEVPDKYWCGVIMALNLMLLELCHYLMAIKIGPQNCGDLLHGYGKNISLPIPGLNIFHQIYVLVDPKSWRVIYSLKTPGRLEY